MIEDSLEDSNDGVSPLPFRTFILSAGGLVQKDAQKALKGWKKALSSFSYSCLLDCIGNTLLRARGKGFQGQSQRQEGMIEETIDYEFGSPLEELFSRLPVLVMLRKYQTPQSRTCHQ